ncbi:MAG: hypothetical protein JHC84_05505 [Solirubrobacteraceae bacterium]|nr:hypothetical protein [Solirubrobacteraceae bacterium]
MIRWSVVVAALLLPAGGAAPAVAAEQAVFSGATASSSASGAGAALATDGRRATVWRARRAGAWTWRGRLTRAAALDRVRVLAPRSIDDVTIAVSTDGRRFRGVRTVDLRGGSWRAVALGGRSARFVRISGRSARRPGGGLAEVEVRLRAAPAPPATGAGAVVAIPQALDVTPRPSPPVPDSVPAPGPDLPRCAPAPRTPDPPAPAAEPRGTPAPGTDDAPAATPSGATPFAGVVTDPIDQRHLASLPFHSRSHWLQPWRAFLDTPPAARLRNALGINFNPETEDMEAVARLLAASGFRRARIEIPWGDFAYEDPTRLIHRARFERALCAVRDAGLRPLILLNSNDQRPAPSFTLDLTLAAEAEAGDTEVQLTAESAAAVIPPYTGFDGTFGAQALITELKPGNVAVLSQPLVLPRGRAGVIPAGATLPATVLRYVPFSPPVHDDGAPNPYSEETMRGWLAYVEATTGFVRSMLGTTAFDVEVSNELNLNASFWDVNNYFEPDPFDRGLADQVIVDRTLSWIRDPANDLAGVRVTNGFASQRPWDSGATSPAGLDALSKHFYPRNLRFPDIMTGDPPDGLRFNRPVDATGAPTGTRSEADGTWSDPFVPTYDAFFPEFWLAGIRTETLARDLSPWEDLTVNPPVAHGRTVATPGGNVPELWMTEIGLETGWAQETLGLDLSDDDVARMRAKAALRTFVAFVHQGFRQVDLYAAADGEWGLIGGDFWRLLRETGAYPGDRTGGPVMDGVRRLVGALGDGEVTTARALTLASIGDYGGRTQFTGDGSAAHPDLHDRDVLAFLPFQAADDRFVVPVYVMTRNLAREYGDGGGPARFDLPEERYQLTIGGTNASRVQASAVDPLTGDEVPVDVVRRTGDGWLVVEMPVTDSPRLLILDDAAAGAELP